MVGYATQDAAMLLYAEPQRDVCLAACLGQPIGGKRERKWIILFPPMPCTSLVEAHLPGM